MVETLYLAEGVSEQSRLVQGVAQPGIAHLPWAQLQTTRPLFFQPLRPPTPTPETPRPGQDTDSLEEEQSDD
jgi:hypothetical protein